MRISNLKIADFRKFGSLHLNFPRTISVILGPNACGKTTILEAIFLLATGKSFRAEKDMEAIAFESELARTSATMENATIDKTNEQIELEVVLTRGEVMGIKTPMKRFLVNGVGKHTIDFVGRLRVVLFWPEDLELVTDSPSLRRRYLDFVLIQVDREYRRTLLSYERGLRQRNKLLEAIRDAGAHRHQLLFWDQLLIKSGEYITKKREEYISYLNNAKTQGLKDSKLDKYQLVYDNSIISRPRLDQYSEEEVAAGATLVGPHRDDMKFKVKSQKLKVDEEEFRDLSHYGSRGEQRLGVLWLKLGELAYIEHVTEEKPVLLLDDILSELDHDHRKIIFGVIGQQQTIMTVTDVHLFEKKSGIEVEVIEL